MDKRSLLFVGVLAATLFMVNMWFGGSKTSPLPPKPIITATPQEQAPLQQENERFYVLENPYQQLVFSSLGGALTEINLPLRSKENTQSIVLPIDFDRTLAKQEPTSDRFPMRGSKTPEIGGYYPLLRRGTQKAPLSSAYYALNLSSEDPNLSSLSYTLKYQDKNRIVFESDEGKQKITKTFFFPDNPSDTPYCFYLTVSVEGEAKGLWLSSGVPEVELISDNPAPALKYRVTRANKAQIELLDLPKAAVSFNSVHPDWICNSNGFLGLIIDPLSEVASGFRANKVAGDLDPSRITLIDAHYNLYPADKYPGYQMYLPLRSSAQETTFRIYAGPFQEGILKTVDTAFESAGYNPGYVGALSFHGWFTFISEPFAKFLFMLMRLFHSLTSSWGISIILLTAALRIMLYPLNAWSIRSTAKMQQIAPQVSALQAKYKKDPKRAQLEVMNLYREQKINPLMGCFPILIQIPFLMGMFDLLKSTFDLRGASFIPGWIDNLTAPDVVFSWGYPVPFFGTQFHLLPLLLGIVMYLQQKYSSAAPKDKTLLTDQQKQQKFMGNLMVVVFTVMFYHFPSGLNIYWLSSMALGIVQQKYMMRKINMKVVTGS